MQEEDEEAARLSSMQDQEKQQQEMKEYANLRSKLPKKGLVDVHLVESYKDYN